MSRPEQNKNFRDDRQIHTCPDCRLKVDVRTDDWDECVKTPRHRWCANKDIPPAVYEFPMPVSEMTLVHKAMQNNTLTYEQAERFMPAIVGTIQRKVGRAGKVATDRQASYAVRLVARLEAYGSQMEHIVRSAFVVCGRSREANQLRRSKGKDGSDKGGN